MSRGPAAVSRCRLTCSRSGLVLRAALPDATTLDFDLEVAVQVDVVRLVVVGLRDDAPARLQAATQRHLDRIPGVDITDDYASEKKEVEAHGRKLSYYKWLAKATLGGKLVAIGSPRSSVRVTVSYVSDCLLRLRLSLT